MAVKAVLKEMLIESEHDGYLTIIHTYENDDVWLEIRGDNGYPFIIESEADIDALCKALKSCKKLLKQNGIKN